MWKTARLDVKRLESSQGKPIAIYNPGNSNPADGPDFLQAHIKIGRFNWFGDVELHWRTSDWNRHGHQQDANYNRVILHVVWTDDATKSSDTLREDGSAIPKLRMKEFVPKPLQSFLDQFQKPESLPCSGHISYISRQAFEQQIEKAGREYFEKKVNDLLSFWDPSLPPSKAWLKMLAIGLYDGLGIVHNREPMRNFCKILYRGLEEINSKQQLQECSIALFEKQKATPNEHLNWQWVHKGSRPPNQPKARLQQAACCLWFLHTAPFNLWISDDPTAIWNRLNRHITVTPGLGKQRKDILFGTVWMPAFFILGNILSIAHLRESSLQTWHRHQVRLPKSVVRPFKSLAVPESAYRSNLGSIHQLRAYCKPRHCKRCKVFKSVISS